MRLLVVALSLVVITQDFRCYACYFHASISFSYWEQAALDNRRAGRAEYKTRNEVAGAKGAETLKVALENARLGWSIELYKASK